MIQNAVQGPATRGRRGTADPIEGVNLPLVRRRRVGEVRRGTTLVQVGVDAERGRKGEGGPFRAV